MSLSLGIDIFLILLFIIVVFICYRRGIFKTLVTVLKVLISLIATFYIQTLLMPLIEPYLPIDINVVSSSGSIFEQYFNVIVGNFVSSFIIFIALYIIFTIFSNLLLNFLDRFSVTKFINKLGGTLFGLVLASVIVLIASYVISIILLVYNSTIAISTIYESYLLKFLVANNIKIILDTFTIFT